MCGYGSCSWPPLVRCRGKLSSIVSSRNALSISNWKSAGSSSQRDPGVLPRLRPLLTDPDRHVRANASFVIAGLGDPIGIETVVDIVNDRSPDRRVSVPGSTGQPSPRAQIREDRYYAVHMLGEMKDAAAIPTLLSLWNDPDLNYAIPWSLSQIDGPDAIRGLIGALSNPSADVRAYACEALGTLRATEALPRLTELLQDQAEIHSGKIPTVAEYARQAIAAIQR